MAVKNVVLRFLPVVLAVVTLSLNSTSLCVAEGGKAPENTVLLDFYGPQCPPCRAMRPVIEQLKQAGYPVKSINVSEYPVMAQKFSVTNIPCFIMVSDGNVVFRTVGITSANTLATQCQSGIDKALFAQRQRNRNWTKDGLRQGNYDVLADKQRSAANSEITGLRSNATVVAANVNSPRINSPSVTIPPSVKPVSSSITHNFESTDSNSNLSPERLLAASVRIRVKTAQFYDYGSGTIIDARNNRALILTCGHLFRDYAKEKGGTIEVDMFGQSPLQNVEARYICHDLESDLGLISIPLSHPVQTIPVAPLDYQAIRGATVSSVGCDNGRAPTVQPGQVVAINRYLGPANIHASGSSVQGRSGGGLFSKEGYIIGVTLANESGENQALYCSYPAIHQMLSKHNLSDIVTAPCNDSSRLSEDRLVSMPKEMPRPETVVELTGMPIENNSSSSNTTGVLASVTPRTPLSGDSNVPSNGPLTANAIPEFGTAAIIAPVNGPIGQNSKFAVRPATPQWPPQF